MKEEIVNWEEIEIGDYIVLSLPDFNECPCDLLILDASDFLENKENKCYVDQFYINGKVCLEEKKPLNSTKVDRFSKDKGNPFKFFHSLHGKMEYENPNESCNTFNGFMKLKKDPKGENFNMENLILKGSKLSYSEWIFGVAVYTGFESKSMSNLKRKIFKYSKIFILNRKFILSGISQSFFFAVVLTIFSFNSVNPFTKTTENVFETFIKFLILCSPFVPISLFFIQFLQNFLIIKFSKQKILNDDRDFSILNSESFSNLSNLQYAFFGKSTIFDNSEFELKFMLLKTKFFKFNDFNFDHLMTEHGPRLTNIAIEEKEEGFTDSMYKSIDLNYLWDDHDREKTKYKEVEKDSIIIENFENESSASDRDLNKKKSIEKNNENIENNEILEEKKENFDEEKKDKNDIFEKSVQESIEIKKVQINYHKNFTFDLLEGSEKESINYSRNNSKDNDEKDDFIKTKNDSEILEKIKGKKSLFSQKNIKFDIDSEKNKNESDVIEIKTRKIQTNNNIKNDFQGILKIKSTGFIDDKKSNNNNFQFLKKNNKNKSLESIEKIESYSDLSNKDKNKGLLITSGRSNYSIPSEDKKDFFAAEKYKTEFEPNKLLNSSNDFNEKVLMFLESDQDKIEEKPSLFKRKSYTKSEEMIKGENDSNEKKINYTEIIPKIKNEVVLFHDSDKKLSVQISNKNEPKFHRMKSLGNDAFDKMVVEKDLEVEEALLALTLCHQTRFLHFKKTLNIKSDFQYFMPEDKEILQFCRNKDYIFEKVSQNKIERKLDYILRYNDKKHHFEVLGINNFSIRKCFSIVIRNKKKVGGSPTKLNAEEYSVLYIRGSYESIKENLVLATREKIYLENLFEQLTKKGIKTIIYAKKKLSKEDTENYLKNYRILKNSLSVQSENLHSFYNELESQLEFISLIGLYQQTNIEIEPMITHLKKSKIKFCLISSSKFSSTMRAFYCTGYCRNDGKVIN